MPTVKLLRVERGGAVVVYQVTFGMLSTEVVMLNLVQKAKSFKRKIIAKGTYGQILEVHG